ncbi:hypothetical protein RJ639_022126 [Escallonia herrerae]|uniref:Chalcone/stilbene synthase N-terminal domain-containing protein n=1 Tax=Escallonia herrerae TaxID=1293975 RepID=A0AA88V573_9ASTE|nr:hypothetical protein RJ639_022126 [Escallonia herrerae]
MIYQQGCFAGGTVLRLAKDLAENNISACVLVVYGIYHFGLFCSNESMQSLEELQALHSSNVHQTTFLILGALGIRRLRVHKDRRESFRYRRLLRHSCEFVGDGTQ